MYLKLKPNHIIRLSPSKPMLINTEEDIQIAISKIESVILSMLDGTKTEDSLVAAVLSELQINTQKEIELVNQNIKNIITHFSSFITFEENSSSNIENIVYGDLSYELPYELSIELTNKCLLECRHCYKEAGHSCHSFINKKDLINFLQNLGHKVHTVQLTGGEALMHPDFWEILEFCKTNFKEVIISTTGLLITNDNIEKFKGTRVYLSLYSFNPKENKNYVGKDVLDKILSTINLLKENGIHVCINTIVSDRTIEDLPQFIKRCELLKVDGVGLGKNTLVGRAKELTSEDHCSAYCEQCVRKIEKEFSSDQMYLSTFITDTLPQELRCGYYKWIINENGKIMPCAFFPENFSLGHICDPIESIFTPQKYSKMLKNLGKLAKDMSARGEQITNICEALYLVEE